jgi:hypothetical protein
MALTRPRYSNIVDTDFKSSCRIVTTTNITLAGSAPSTYDGVTLAAGDRVLVAGQNTSSQNGIYYVSTLGTGSNGTWTRALDANDNTRITAGMQTAIGEGTYGGHTWRLTTPDPIVLGTTGLTFLDAQSSAAGTNTQLQYNSSGQLAGASGITIAANSSVVATANVVSTGNLIANTIYASTIRWSANSQLFSLTGNINPTVYLGNLKVTTANTLVDSVLVAGNTSVNWTAAVRDTVNNRVKLSKIESVTDGTNVYLYETKVSGSGGAYPVAAFVANVTAGAVQLWAVGDSASVIVTYERRTLGTGTPTGYINNFGPQGAAGTINNTGGDIVTTSSTPSTSTTTGALRVAGGAGIAGNVYIGANAVVGLDLSIAGNLYVGGSTTTLNTNTLDVEDLNITVAKGSINAAAADGAGLTVDGAGASIVYTASADGFTINKNILTTGIQWSGNSAVYRSGINYYTQATPPAGANYGDQWYDTTTDIVFEWTPSDGANGFWVDITTSTVNATNTGVFTGNLIGNVVGSTSGTFTGNVTAQYFLGNAWFADFPASAFGNTQVNAYNTNVWAPAYTGNLQAGNITLTGTRNKFVGDFTNATLLQRTLFQTVTNNSSTGIYAVPSGSSQAASWQAANNSDPTNASKILIATNGTTDVQLVSGINGSGTYLPLSFYTNGSNQMQLSTSGNLTLLTGNLLVTNGYISGTYTPATATGAAIQLTGKDTQGGTGWFDFLKATNTTSGATNPNKTIRLNSVGGIEVINSAYTTTLLSLSDTGAFSVSGSISVSGKKAVNGPAFSAYADATLQTITSGSQQKVLFQVEDFDTDGCFASSRFTPNVEGYYQLNAEVRLDGSSGTGEIMIVLYKNTSEHKRGTNQQGTSIATNFFAMQVSALVYANGTTDYFEIKVQQTSGSSMTVTAVNNPAITWFNGAMVRGA